MFFLNDIPGGSCSSGYKEGIRGNSTRCLKLPDPVGGGNTRYSGNYLNFLFSTYANGTDLSGGTIPNETRMTVAKRVATDLVNNSSGMRFGVSSFYAGSGTSQNYGHGATIDATCGSSTTDLTSAISGYSASTSTPLSEALYEITRYFRGMSSYYHSDVSYTSPIQYRCQKNFTIVITDGLPTYDTNIPASDPDDNNSRLPNWDGLAPDTSSSMYPNFPQYSDGFQPTDSEAKEGYSLYLDDLAKFAYDIDMRRTGTDNADVSYNDPEYKKQNLNTYTIGFAADNQMMEDAAEYGHGQYFTASNSAQLIQALQRVVNDIAARTASAAAVAVNTTTVSSDTRIYQATFDSGSWAGDLQAYPVEIANGEITKATPSWTSGSANTQLKQRVSATTDTRKIISYNGSTGIAFTWATLSSAQKTHLVDENRLNFLRGRTQDEGVTFRDRDGPLGDIVNSQPVYVAKPPFTYSDATYQTFKSDHANRTPMIYVGANDGMLHAFNASTGAEAFAYVPNLLMDQLKNLSNIPYAHQYYVDGPITVGDVYTGTSWKTLLVGGLGKGGKGFYALDVTNPTSTTEEGLKSIVKWEFTDADMGYSFGRPLIIKTAAEGWVVAVTSGYNNSGQGYLYLLNPDTGAIIEKISTTIGTAANPSGLGQPSAADEDGDGVADYIYAGDLNGSLWKFDLTASNSNSWDIAFKVGSTKLPLITVKNASNQAQPITAAPEIVKHPTNGMLIILFGTGRYLGATDATDTQTQSFYAIKDSGSAIASTDRRTLVQQSLYTATINGQQTRLMTSNNVDWTVKDGWYMDFIDSGERNVTNPQVRNGALIFTSFIPNEDPCSFGGTGWLYDFNYLTGAAFEQPELDINNDGELDGNDVTGDVTSGDKTYKGTPGALQIGNGFAAKPTILDDGLRDKKFISKSDTSIRVVMERGGNKRTGNFRPISWREVF